MRPTRQVVARISVSRTPEPQPSSRTQVLDAPFEPSRPVPPLPRLGAADRICDALRRWLEEEM
jgi:hypothetical protein